MVSNTLGERKEARGRKREIIKPHGHGRGRGQWKRVGQTERRDANSKTKSMSRHSQGIQTSEW